jgi:uncharacterized protein YbjT (DUF2867 family)
MKRILVTGATGNVGFELINFLNQLDIKNEIIAGVRNIEKAKKQFDNFPNLIFRNFDFEDSASFNNALEHVDIVFLLRPPHISDIEKFKPLLGKIKEKGIQEVLFLSVQGAEKSKVIPHNKIESLIQETGLNYIFLRPSYFMQNLITTLKFDIQSKRKVILPSGKAKFNWIDIKNIGEACAILINKFSDYRNRAIELTGYENESFEKVVETINSQVETNLIYECVNPIKFYQIKRKDGVEKGMVMVMLLLHFLPRFQKEPRISKFYEELTGKQPTSLIEFIKREKNQFYAL